jgi:hypothetical protein
VLLTYHHSRPPPSRIASQKSTKLLSRVAKRKQLANMPKLDELIREVRGQKVILDTDLARIYGIPTFRFNEAIKRNRERFPEDFMFRLTAAEFAALTSQFAISKKGALLPRSAFPFFVIRHSSFAIVLRPLTDHESRASRLRPRRFPPWLAEASA